MLSFSVVQNSGVVMVVCAINGFFIWMFRTVMTASVIAGGDGSKNALRLALYLSDIINIIDAVDIFIL